MFNENGDRVETGRDILAEIGAATQKRIALQREQLPLEILKAQAEVLPKGDFPFETALKQPGMSFICEAKKASPSKGLIAPDFPYLDIAREYQTAGAAAISCLTEPQYFQGQDRYLAEMAGAVSIPLLRKDFFVDPYMIYQAKVLGASAILLICALLSDAQLAEYFQIAESLGLSALFEAHDAQEVTRALACGARIVGVNNRNLKTFQLDLQNSVNLRQLVPSNVIFVSESGIKTPQDVAQLASCGVDAVLIGETFMRAPDKTAALQALRGTPRVKLCGLTRPQDIEVANRLNPDYVGFVFAKSRRQLTPQQAQGLKSQLAPQIQAVGVFVNPDLDQVVALVNQGVIDVVQLHGREDEAFIAQVATACPGTPIIKALSVRSIEDVLAWQDSAAHFLLLDNGAGGTGEAFDWGLLAQLEGLKKPYFIAGGLAPHNVTQVLGYAPFGVDVSSGIETDGVKDSVKMNQFVENVRNHRE